MILASQSPRRRELLAEAGFELDVRPADVDESRLPDERPVELVGRLAAEKAEAARVATGIVPADRLLVAADTIVWIGDEALGKPAYAADAARMLHGLSGRTHHVYTGVYITDGSRETLFYERSAVTFYPLSPSQIEAYVRTREPLDKAGGYAIQGRGALLVRRVAGDYLNIVGLPLARTARELEAFGF